MLPLSELQTVFRQAIFDADPHAREKLGALIAPGDPEPDERIAIYANNVFASLTEALKETFPAVCRLVDERFFSYAAHAFIADRPPSRPSLIVYGHDFPDFLAAFPPSRSFPYLADVARFEWLMNAAAHAPDVDAVAAASLTGIAPDDAPCLVFALHPSYGYVSSRFPVDAIWRANRTCEPEDADIDLDAGGVSLEVSRQGDDVVFRKLGPAVFALRQALARGLSLGEALERAFAREPDFAPADALGTLFAEGAIAAVTLPSVTEQRS